MDLSFRQGIVRHQTALNGPAWLQKTSSSGSTVDLNANQEPTIITFAQGAANYLVEETQSVSGAWGGSHANSNNGPLPAGETSYLYWDIDLATSALSRGWTRVPWIATTAEPLNPTNDLHWFDLNRNIMRVYRKIGTAPGFWQDRIRVFAGVLFGNSVLVPYNTGTQVGLNVPCQAGNIMLGTNNVPLKQSDGTFVTTTSKLIIQQTSGQNVQFDAALVYAQAAEEIPAFYLVAFKENKTVKLASSNDMLLQVAGISLDPLYEQEVGQIISNGRVRNNQWEFSAADIGKPLFCGPTGQLMLTPPPIGTLQQVAVVYDVSEIFINVLNPVRLTGGPNFKPLVMADDGWQAEMPAGGVINAGGTYFPTFTVNGKGLLFDDGTSTAPGSSGTGATLQTVYDNSPIIAGAAGIKLTDGKDFILSDPNSGGSYFSVAASDGTVRINGDLVVTGNTTTVNTTITEANTLKLSPNTSIVTPFIIEPDLGITPIVDLITIRRTFGAAPVFRIDANGNMVSTKDLTIAGLINGISITQLAADFQKHLAGDIGFRHYAEKIDIYPISTIPGAVNVQQALAYIGANLNGGGGGGNAFGFNHVQTFVSTIWTIVHSRQTLRANVQVWDENYELIIPESVKVIDGNTIQISFNQAMKGSATLILF